MSPRRRLGLFGGSFDPVHLGHLHAARAAAGAFDLERVVFVPAARPPHKPERILAAGSQRLRMLEIAVEPEPTWCVSDLELARSGPSYTIDTVQALAAHVDEPAQAEIHLILGSDNLPGLADWYRARELLEQVRPVVVLRDETDRALLEELSPALVERLGARIARRVHDGVLALPPVPVRSTDLRLRIAAGENVGDELPPGVWEYVLRHGVYRAEP